MIGKKHYKQLRQHIGNGVTDAHDELVKLGYPEETITAEILIALLSLSVFIVKHNTKMLPQDFMELVGLVIAEENDHDHRASEAESTD